jgi:hypothetical protein
MTGQPNSPLLQAGRGLCAHSVPDREQPAERQRCQAEGTELVKLKNIDVLLDGNGEIILGRVGPIDCAAIAADDDNRCLAMLVRRPDESLIQLLVRLDAAIEDAWERDNFVDEIHG